MTFLTPENIHVVNHPPYSRDLSPARSFYFKRLKKLYGKRNLSRIAQDIAIYQCLRQIPTKDYLTTFHDWEKKKDCINMFGKVKYSAGL